MPSDKRARQRAGRQARHEELRQAQRRAQQRRRGLVIGVIILAAVGLTIYAAERGGGSSKAAARTGSTTTTVAPSAGKATAASLAALVARPAPAHSAACSASPAVPSSTTTVPAKGNAVSVVDAPAGVGFPSLDGTSPRYTHFTGPPPFCIDPSKTYTATMKTDVGTITLALYPKDAPVTVNNFVFLAGYHYFDGTVFHRVIPGFVDQGGDPTGTGTGGPGYSFADELPKSAAAYDDGALAMANSGPNTNGSQFFLVIGSGGSSLQPSYTDFGQITAGLDVAKKINADGDASDNGSPPKVTHKILSVSVTES